MELKKGLKISSESYVFIPGYPMPSPVVDICLTMHKSITGRPRFHVRVSISGRSIDATTTKKRLTEDRKACWDESLSLPLYVTYADLLYLVSCSNLVLEMLSIA